MNEIDAGMVRDLYQAYWHDPAVISADADGWHQVEPLPAAVTAGRRIICTQRWLDYRFHGRPLGEDDFTQAARELAADKVPGYPPDAAWLDWPIYGDGLNVEPVRDLYEAAITMLCDPGPAARAGLTAALIGFADHIGVLDAEEAPDAR